MFHYFLAIKGTVAPDFLASFFGLYETVRPGIGTSTGFKIFLLLLRFYTAIFSFGSVS